jgi:simple sugar transport system substrate-binding protein
MNLHERCPRYAVRTLVVLSAAALVLAACSSTGGKSESTGSGSSAAQAGTPRATIAMITHAPPGDAFWDLIRKGAQAAADKDNIDLRYSSDGQAPNQANLVQTAIDTRVDGIALTLAKPDAMSASVKAAVAAGIPVVAFNAGIDNWEAAGALAYFGQDERLAGTTAGKRLAASGAKHVLCVIHEQGQVAHEARCAGVKDGFTGATDIVYVNGTDMPSVQSTVTAKLQQDPSIDAVVTLGAPWAETVVESVKAAGSNAKVATFDTDAALVDAIKNGSVDFAVDQQPYLQGYLAIDSLWLYLNNKNIIGGGQPTLTGPSFVDKSNIDSVAELAKAGTR